MRTVRILIEELLDLLHVRGRVGCGRGKVRRVLVVDVASHLQIPVGTCQAADRGRLGGLREVDELPHLKFNDANVLYVRYL